MPENETESKSDRKYKRRAKRMNRLFDDIKAGAIIQVERRISKVHILHLSNASL
jgi:hypothetical protein